MSEVDLEIARVHRPSRAEFERRFLATETPVVISGAMTDWPALQLWTSEYLKARAGERTIPVSVAHAGVHLYEPKAQILDYSTMKLAEYVDLITASRASEGRLYACAVPIRQVLPELWEDLRFPPYFESAECSATNLWYGPADNVSPLHYDELHNFLTQVRGRKKVVLYPPHELQNLYPYPAHYAALHVSQVNVRAPDHQRFPAFRRAVSGVAELGPGDMLFLPMFWWHSVVGLEENISVNYWWKPPTRSYLRHPRQLARGLCGKAAQRVRRKLGAWSVRG